MWILKHCSWISCSLGFGCGQHQEGSRLPTSEHYAWDPCPSSDGRRALYNRMNNDELPKSLTMFSINRYSWVPDWKRDNLQLPDWVRVLVEQRGETSNTRELGVSAESNSHLQLVQKMAEIIGREARELGANQLFAPEVDLARELRYGRVRSPQQSS